MSEGDWRARVGWPSRSGGSVSRDMTGGDIFNGVVAETEGEIGVTPWRRVHRARLQAVVGFPGLW